jgi:hypothetical protein
MSEPKKSTPWRGRGQFTGASHHPLANAATNPQPAQHVNTKLIDAFCFDVYEKYALYFLQLQQCCHVVRIYFTNGAGIPVKDTWYVVKEEVLQGKPPRYTMVRAQPNPLDRSGACKVRVLLVRPQGKQNTSGLQGATPDTEAEAPPFSNEPLEFLGLHNTNSTRFMEDLIYGYNHKPNKEFLVAGLQRAGLWTQSERTLINNLIAGAPVTEDDVKQVFLRGLEPNILNMLREHLQGEHPLENRDERNPLGYDINQRFSLPGGDINAKDVEVSNGSAPFHRDPLIDTSVITGLAVHGWPQALEAGRRELQEECMVTLEPLWISKLLVRTIHQDGPDVVIIVCCAEEFPDPTLTGEFAGCSGREIWFPLNKVNLDVLCDVGGNFTQAEVDDLARVFALWSASNDLTRCAVSPSMTTKVTNMESQFQDL